MQRSSPFRYVQNSEIGNYWVGSGVGCGGGLLPHHKNVGIFANEVEVSLNLYPTHVKEKGGPTSSMVEATKRI